MTIRIKRIDPLQAGKVLAAVYGLLCLVFIPIMFLVFLFGPTGSGIQALVMTIVMPILYVVFGFIGGVIGAVVYNLVAGWIGGIQIETEEV